MCIQSEKTDGTRSSPSNECVIVVDGDLKIRYASHSLVSFFSQHDQKLSGKPLGELFDPASCDALAEWMRASSAPGNLKLKLKSLTCAEPLERIQWIASKLGVDEGPADYALLSGTTGAGEESGLNVPGAARESSERSMAAELELLYRQLERFGTITAEVITMEDTEQLFNQFAKAITEISDFSRTLISVFTNDPPYRDIIAHSGVEEEKIKPLREIEFSRDRLRALMRKEFQLSSNCYYIPGSRKEVLKEEEVVYGTRGSDLEDGWHPDDNLLVTLRRGDELFGFFSVDDSKSGKRPTSETVKPLELFATQITQVIARNRLEEELRRRHRDLQLLYDISVFVNSSLDADEALQKFAEAIRERMEYSHVSVYLIEDGRLVRKTVAGTDPTVDSAILRIGEGIVGSAAREGSVIIANDVSAHEGYIDAVVGTRSEISVPIKSTTIVDGEETESVIGVLNAETTIPNAFTEEDGRRLEAIANTASIAIENSRLMERVLSLLKEEANYSQELEQKKDELDEFVHTISHDLKSPLNSIKGYAEMLDLELKGKLDEDSKRFLTRITANADMVSRMITDLLELSRVGRVVEESHPVSLEKLLDEIRFDMKASGEGTDAEFNIVDLPDTVNGDRRRLGQLFSNLILNAVKYRHPGRTPVITIGCNKKGAKYEFYVSDNGIGIDPAHLSSIFVFGVRIREKDISGTGAGLAIAKKIVETWGGRIWAESTKGEGSTFFFTMPK